MLTRLLRPFLAAAILSSAAGAAAQPIAPAVEKRIDRILRQTPLIDGHNDLPWALRGDFQSRVDGLENGGDRREPPLMTDMERLRAGRVGGQFWSVYISGTLRGDEAIRTTLEQIDTARRLIAAYPRHLEQATSADDLVRIHKAGRIGSMLGIEGGRQIGGSMAALRQFYALGVRYMTLTHGQTTEWADSGTDAPRHDGLAPFGIAVVREMNRLGMLVDLSHVSPAAAADAITASAAPVIFSHSVAAALNPHPRNVPDSVLQMLPANGGVVMVTFVPPFLSRDYYDWSREKSAQEARLKALYPFDPERVKTGLAEWQGAHPAPVVGVKAVADHIDHIARIAGHEHVGIGGDLDGIDVTVEGLGGVDGYPLLFAELIARGWSDRDLARLAGGNVLRALRRAEAVSAAMRDVPPSLESPAER